MSKKPNRLTRRRFLGATLVTGMAATGAGAGTYALFQDTEKSTGNAVQMGTMDLVLTNDDTGDQPYTDGVSGSFTLDNARPGDTFEGNIAFKNAGTLDADHLELDFGVNETEGTYSGTDDDADTKDGAVGMARQVEVINFNYPNKGSDSYVYEDDLTNGNGNGFVDVDDLVNHNEDVLSRLQPAPKTDGHTALSIDLKWRDLPSNNDFQGDTLEIIVTASLHQKESQDA